MTPRNERGGPASLVDESVAPMPAVWAIAGVGLILVVIALRYAEPTLDGDLYWHMALARQMIERGTLVPDHRIYAWTPSSNALIYCAWVAELALYAIYRSFGLAGIFVFRYIAIVAMAALAWRHAARCGLGRAPATIPILLILVLASQAGTLAKPELFSLLLFNFLLFAYAGGRERFRDGGDPRRFFYLVPAATLLWANSHGGFIMAAPLLAALAAGELLLFAIRHPAALSKFALGHLVAAWFLCLPAVFATPYGWTYPAQLVADYLFGATPRPDIGWNNAYRSILDAEPSFREYLTVIVIGLGGISWFAIRRTGGRAMNALPLVAAAIAFAPLYVAYLRSTYLLTAIAAYAALSLLGEIRRASPPSADRPTGKPAKASALVAAVVSVAFGGQAIAGAWYRPDPQAWLGFGHGYVNPVAEAEFLARQPEDVGHNIYNVFDSGGYLLWRLYPRFKVMTDSRSFPYLAWFADQFAFTTGESFAGFIAKYPADIAVADLEKRDLWVNFLKTRDWRLVFYGPTAAIFAREPAFGKFRRADGDGDPRRFFDLRSAHVGFRVFEFATFIGDYRTAALVLRRAETLAYRADPEELDLMRTYVAGIRAVMQRNYAAALPLLERGLGSRAVSDRDRFVYTLVLGATKLPAGRGKELDKIDAALRKVVPPGFDVE